MRIENKKAFTLIEALVIVVILGFLLAMMPRVLGGDLAQRRFDKTRERMEEIKKALFGSAPYYSNSRRKVTGYIVDMGRLSPLDINSNQPKALWTNDLDEDGAPDLPDWKSLSIEVDPYCMFEGKGRTIFIGWRGPYMEKPPGGVLKDGWGSPFIFSTSDGDMTIKSYGADGMEGGSGFNEDITLSIKQREYMSIIAGQISFEDGLADNVRIRVYYPSDGLESKKTIKGVKADGYFRFEFVPGERDAKGRANVNIPIGMRPFIVWVENDPAEDPEADKPLSDEKQEMILFYVRPALNWVGRLKLGQDSNP